MDIGERLRLLRMENGLTQEELADRSELTKGYISQIERDLSSPSIATLIDILEALGTTLADFFNEKQEEQIVFGTEDWFEKIEDTLTIEWIIPNAQKNDMEPIIVTLHPLAQTEIDEPHMGEEFGYVLSGKVNLYIGQKKHIVNKGETFYFQATNTHYLQNASSRKEAKILWVATPPSF